MYLAGKSLSYIRICYILYYVKIKDKDYVKMKLFVFKKSN